jgi:hypothetical protein
MYKFLCVLPKNAVEQADLLKSKVKSRLGTCKYIYVYICIYVYV